MSRKLQKRVNGGLALYFGIGSLFGAIMGVVALVVMLYRLAFQDSSISWSVFLMVVFIILLSGGMAYALLRVGYEEIEGN